MALLLAPVDAGRTRRLRHHRARRVRATSRRRCRATSGVGDAPASPGQTLTLDDPFALRRFDARESRVLARGRHPLLRAVRLEGRDDRGDGAGRQGERRAAQQRGHGAARRPWPRRWRRRSRTAGSIASCSVKADELDRDAAVQREHPRVAGRRPAGARPRRARRPLEPRARRALRRAATSERVGRRARRAVRRPFVGTLQRRRRDGRRERRRACTACR